MKGLWLHFHYSLNRYIAVFVFMFCFSLFAIAQQKTGTNQRYIDYINAYRDVAIYQMLKYKIPASITMAQGLLESAAGQSELARKGNNHFGIKCHDWLGPSMNRDDDETGECFRVYSSAYESFEDHSKFLLRPRYKRLFSLRQTDYAGWARGLKECGYATNPRYAQLLIDLIRRYNLDDLDHERKYDEKALRRVSPSVGVGTLQKNFANGFGHEVRMCNKNYYVIARSGDTFRSIAKEFDLSYRKLAKYNERDKNDVLRNGDIVYLEKKRSKADKIYKRRPHIVKPGESLYSIAQRYGVRLSSLYKKNKIPTDYTLRVGDVIKVY